MPGEINALTDLIINPADDYVKEFTGDVPIARVLTASTVIDKTRKPTARMPRVSADTSVETLLPQLADHKNGIAVENAAGKVIGVATAQNVVNALASEAAKRPDDEGAAA